MGMDAFGTPMTPAEYADQWVSDSAVMDSRSDYAWMAGLLPPSTVILEVGCGAGASTVAITRTGRAVIAIEQNEHMVSKARERLSSLCIRTAIAQPEQVTTPAPGEAVIVTQSVLDSNLEGLMRAWGVDGIACWLIGTEPTAVANSINGSDDDFRDGDIARYRHLVHRRCYELGRSVVPAGGGVHVVDRCVIKGWFEKNRWRARYAYEHKALAGGGYTIGVDNVWLRRIPDVFGTSKIQYLMDREPDDARYVACVGSVAAIRC